ncbi:hypothetical protein Vadar_000032 [Vaccinium darrowii]|uniref:Uncharacterized protein n=1 Tax=Vaccinium darrowii TaxID=229202 RepID=A0ACB7YAM1_9ERIC|nr:hypothetical protein Vadar_000032 [Vaccinium darrowii]
MDSIPSTDKDMEAYALTVDPFLVEALQNPRHCLTKKEEKSEVNELPALCKFTIEQLRNTTSGFAAKNIPRIRVCLTGCRTVFGSCVSIKGCLCCIPCKL